MFIINETILLLIELGKYYIDFDKHGNGWIVNEVAGENLGSHKLVYRNASSTWSLADADSLAYTPALGITMGEIASGKKGEILLWGYIGDNSWTWTPGGEIYVSTVSGELTQMPPSGIGDIVQVVATAVEATLIQFVGSAAGVSGEPWGKTTEASYIIFTDGTTIYAKNGMTGQIDYSGTIASTVIQATINALAATGGKIHLKEGEYVITVGIEVVPNLIIEGSYSYGPGGTRLRSTNCNVFQYSGGTDCPFVIIRDLYLAGGGGTGYGIYFNNKVFDIRLENVYAAEFPQDGIRIDNGWGLVVEGVICERNTLYGMFVTGGNTAKITNGKFNDNLQAGLSVPLDSCVDGSEFSGNGRQGLILASNRAKSIGNKFGSNGAIPVNTYPDLTITGDYCEVIGNCFYGTGATAKYNIKVSSTSDYNVIHSNTIVGAVTNLMYIEGIGNSVKDNVFGAGTIIDLGTNTVFNSKTFQFTEPVVGAIVTASPTGVDVDAATEGALLWGQIPIDTHQVMKIKVWAVATGAPINAGGQMHLAATFNTGGSLEDYNLAANSWAITNFDSEEADYAANKVIHWVIEDGDVGNELRALAAGDSLEFFALYNAGSDPDGATDAVFRCIELEYV